MKKAILAVLLTCLFVSFLWAQMEIPPSGSGTADAPYLVWSLGNLYWIAANSSRWDFCYRQIGNIDASETATWFNGQGWPSIGNSTAPFSGCFDGNQFSILNLHINRTGYTGLFGYLSSATLLDINIQNAVNSSSIGSALLVGFCINSQIENCHVHGTVAQGRGLLAGVVSNSSISYCSASGSVTSNIDDQGGLIGRASNTEISHCSAEVLVTNSWTGSGQPPKNIGGLVGYLTSNSSLDASYTNCQISANGCNNVGGLVGFNSGMITGCYSTGSLTGTGVFLGGLVGRINRYSSIVNSYYNLDSYMLNYEHQITIGALPETWFNQWLSSDRVLDIDQFLTLENNLYLIQGAADIIPLMAFAQNPAYNYRLTADIDLSAYPGYFIPLLAGNFYGSGHSISNLSIVTNNMNCVGFFGCVQNAEIRDLNINNCNITGGLRTGALAGCGLYQSSFHNSATVLAQIYQGSLTSQNAEMSVGGLVGIIEHGVLDSCQSLAIIYVTGNPMYLGGLVGLAEYSSITNSQSNGVIMYNSGSTVNLYLNTGGFAGMIYETEVTDCSADYVNVYGYNNTGGLVGNNRGVITRCYAEGEVEGHDQVGGLVGYNDQQCDILASSSSAVVRGADHVGGLVGSNLGTIINSYARGSVSGTNKVGGLVGDNHIGYYVAGYIHQCYSTGWVRGPEDGSGSFLGGLVGRSWTSAEGTSYWNIQSSEQSTSAMGAGRITSQMTFPHTADTYVGWNFSDIWAPDYSNQLNNGYPYLRNTIPGSPEEDHTIPNPVFEVSIYPNPFTSSAKIEFSLTKNATAHLEIFNLKGQRVRAYELTGLKQGPLSVEWDGKDGTGRRVGSGVYMVRLESGGQSLVRKVMLLK